MIEDGALYTALPTLRTAPMTPPRFVERSLSAPEISPAAALEASPRSRAAAAGAAAGDSLALRAESPSPAELRDDLEPRNGNRPISEDVQKTGFVSTSGAVRAD